ncbi:MULTISPECIES: hypothetical protein [unclassified Bartonella]|uniref:hypothetical protein n=2 Tax=Bartonella TaxID=773 RepID=UPI0035D0A3A1
MMKSLSITRIITFIAFFFISALPASASFGFIDKLTRMFTSVDTMEKYNKLYNKYASESYIGSTHSEKILEAKEYAHRHGYTETDFILKRHLWVIYCGRYVNLLRGDYNILMSHTDLPMALPNVIDHLRRKYLWKPMYFMWAYNESNNSKNPMIYYAKEFLKTTKDPEFDLEEQITDLVYNVRNGYYETIELLKKRCNTIEWIYYIMKP